MQILYFPEIDTLELAFDKIKPVHRTVDGPNDSILMDFDAEGRLIGLTIDSASQTTLLEALKQSPHFRICEQGDRNALCSAAGLNASVFRRPREIRDGMGLTQQEFSGLLGISVRTVQDWEQGRRSPRGPAQKLLQVAAAQPGALLSLGSDEEDSSFEEATT